MRRPAERVLPGLVLVGFLAAALVVNLLLADAQRRGVKALEEAVGAEVSAIAGSQNQRFLSSFGTAAGLSNPENPFTLVEGSPEDLAELEDLLDLARGSLDAGFYLLDADNTITQGVLFQGDAIGTRFEWPGFEELVSSPTFAEGVPGVLPVSDGLTTEQPVIAYVLPIFDQQGAVRGSFVLESAVSEESSLNQEIGALQRGQTGEYLFLDSRGSVIASNDSSLIGQQIDDRRLLTEPEGSLYRSDGRIVVVHDVPSVGWRVVFRQDIDEFEGSLARPLETVGRLLVIVILAAGAALTVLLQRRLRAARAEQERLQALSESQQEFISIVSHELRTPVAGVLGFLETTLDHWEAMDDTERRSALGRAASNARRLQAMTRDVLDTQSVEAGRLVNVLEPVELGGEVRTAVDAARELDGDRAIDLQLPDEPVWVSGDADRLQQVLANLIDNARKHSPAVEPVQVALEVVDGVARVTVRDRGAGIASDSLERIFDKFVRGRGDTVSGTGLGLYISRQVVQAHGGRIWAESPPGEGAAFRFTLPLSAESTTGAADATAAETAPAG